MEGQLRVTPGLSRAGKLGVSGAIVAGLAFGGWTVASATGSGGPSAAPAQGSGSTTTTPGSTTTAPKAPHVRGPLLPGPNAVVPGPGSQQPRIEGTVHSISGSDITVVDSEGFWRSVATSSGTTYREAGASVGASEVKVGSTIVATGTVAADHTTLDATTIQILLPTVAGKVSSISGDTVTVTTPGGGTAKVTLTPTTTYHNGRSSGTRADVKVGVGIVAQGTKAADGSLTATTVTVLPAGGPGSHPVGPGGRWGGGPPWAGPAGGKGSPAPPSTSGSGTAGSRVSGGGVVL
jgi:hypothetical protein